ncbi:MAG: hypothetical protein HOV81_36960 [Kofleriaceae bacterium]|nr:hypothetical protein [Kofleriaceae bacterium]
MKSLALVLVMVVGCGNESGSSTDGGPTGDGGSGSAGADAHVQDPADPVEDVPAFTGIYTFGKLTTDESLNASAGTWFTESTTEHKVSNIRTTYARYRDGMVLQSKLGAEMFIYDQATTTISAAIALPSDAVGHATIRGGLVYIGGSGKLYSYEIATGMWRSRTLPNAGACHHVVAGATRLFAICKNPTTTTNDDVFSTWANRTMSDVATVGTLSPGEGAEFSWITAAPGDDVAYLGSESPDRGCVARATWNTLEPCVFSLRTLTTISDAILWDGQASEDGSLLYVTFHSQANAGKHLYEVSLAQPMARYIRSSIESYATCPDNSVVFQDGTISQRRSGGVTTDVRLGSGGELDMGCPLKKQ